MYIIQSIILGIIQGITEFLPVSSSGHLVFLPKLFGWTDQGLAFDVVVHLGTLLAVIVYFRKKLLRVFKSMLGKGNRQDKNLGWLVILSIIPAGVVGFFFNDYIETVFRSSVVVGAGLIFWGLVLGVADRYSARKPISQLAEQPKWKETLFIGCAQAIALIPGTSRSGITMTAGLFAKLDKKSAAEFSFLISVPVIALAGALEIVELARAGLADISLTVLSAGFIASAVSGFFAIWWLMKIIQKWSFMPFVVYRILVGVLILFFV